MTQIVKRGFVPSDEIEFNEENLTLFKKKLKRIYIT